jgi:hypothetical protein
MWLLVTQPMMVATAVSDHSVTPLLPPIMRGLLGLLSTLIRHL